MANLPILPTIRVREQFTPTVREESDVGSSQGSLGPAVRIKVLNLSMSQLEAGSPIGLLLSLTYAISFGLPLSFDIPTVRIV